MHRGTMGTGGRMGTELEDQWVQGTSVSIYSNKYNY